MASRCPAEFQLECGDVVTPWTPVMLAGPVDKASTVVENRLEMA